MTSTQTIELRQTTYAVPPVIHAVQNDTGRRLKMIVSDETVPAGSVGTLSFYRPDETYYSIACTVGSASNEFIADITQALTQFGKVSCQLKVSGIVSTFSFVINVQEDVSGVATPQEGMTITEVINRAEDAADRAEEAADIAMQYGQRITIEDGAIIIGDTSEEEGGENA